MDIHPYITRKIYYAKYETFDRQFIDLLGQHYKQINEIINLITLYINDDNLYGDKLKTSRSDIINVLLTNAIEFNNERLIKLLSKYNIQNEIPSTIEYSTNDNFYF